MKSENTHTHDTVPHGATTHTLPRNETKRNATTPKLVQADNRLHNLEVVEVTLELFFLKRFPKVLPAICTLV